MKKFKTKIFSGLVIIFASLSLGCYEYQPDSSLPLLIEVTGTLGDGNYDCGYNPTVGQFCYQSDSVSQTCVQVNLNCNLTFTTSVALESGNFNQLFGNYQFSMTWNGTTQVGTLDSADCCTANDNYNYQIAKVKLKFGFSL